MEDSDTPTEMDWETFASLDISARGIMVTDPMVWDTLEVDLPPGVYEIQVRAVHYPQEEGSRISRVRAISLEGGEVGRLLGKVGVDGATIGIFDARIMDPGVCDNKYLDTGQYTRSYESGEPTGVAKWGPGDNEEFAFVTSGFGDGTYEVREITAGKNRVGIEIEFIKPGTPYPF